MEIRHAEPADLERMMEIYAQARRFMADHGNPNQWGPTCWPPRALVAQDIARRRSYVCVADGRVVGDADFESVSAVAGAITPVPGGVGPMTIAMLMKNAILAAERL